MRVVLVLIGIVVSAGCSTFRLHDEGRYALATQSADLAGEISDAALGFDTMQSNVDAVAAARNAVVEELRRTEFEAFLADFAELLPEDALDSISESVDTHIEARDRLYGAIAEETSNINDALDRQKTIKALLKETKSPGSLEASLQRIDGRLEWLQKNLARWQKAFAAARSVGDGPAEATAVADAEGEASTADIDKRIEDYRALIKDIEGDKSVDAARRLLGQTAQEVTQLEQERLLAYRARLRELNSLKTRFDARDTTFFNQIVMPALSAVDAERANRIADAVDGDNRHWSEAWQEAWDDPGECGPWPDGMSLADYVEKVAGGSSLGAPLGGDCEESTPTPLLAVGLAERLVLLQFAELPLDEDLLVELERRKHKQVLGLSAINARQRLDLVRHSVGALQVYYGGGVTPAEMAELVLLASQVTALGVIGANVN